MIVRPGLLIRTRRGPGEPWHYGRIVAIDEHDVLHVEDEGGRRLMLGLVDAQWMFDNGNLETREPTPSRLRERVRLLGR